MRPRHKAAENGALPLLAHLVQEASMRPRHKAAENGADGAPSVVRRPGFNEAAA